ncbi:diguanylate cyclase domain-containing protein [Pectinatus sottacetonis]|uniref:diguanylate cyclase domain-containing protein n=1 Tax=Pectinatus sottacetonis TaxID=1002795 RepID=UPI0018C6A2D8|nr:diguanylate cyclase [Pectinatus sottacetonis]
MVDIDNFKNINDEYGHLKGDHVLKEVAIILQKALTEKGILYRWGGEEFIALLDIDATDEIIHMAEKMRRTVSMHKFINVRKITASFGVARWRYTDDYEKLLKRLDNSLYLAKFTGKNKIVYEENLNIVENGKPIEIEWGPFFSTNNPEIDKDHYKLVALSNELIKNSVNGSKKEVISGLLAQMLKNIVMHFKKEEKVMYNLHYKDFTKHRQSHRDLIVRILNLYDEYLIKNKDVVKVIEYLIQEVIIEHILKRDSEFYDTYSR